jgi:hypothetical protein
MACHFFARHVDSIDDCVRAPQSACNCCRQPSHLFHGGGMLSRASHGSRSALRSRWDHASAACVARCRSRLTLILDRIKRCCWRCNAVDLRGAPHQHTDAPDLARQLIELIAPVPPPRQSVACPAALQRKAPPRRGLELGDQRLQYSSLVRLFYGRSRSRLHVAQNENPATLFLRGGVSAAPSGVCW